MAVASASKAPPARARAGTSTAGAATAAATALQALCDVFAGWRDAVGPSWQAGAAVYGAWCAVFLEADGGGGADGGGRAPHVHRVRDPGLAAAQAAGAGGDAAGGGVREQLKQQCVHLSGLLVDVALSSSPPAASAAAAAAAGSSWWRSPLQRMVHTRMNAATARALERLNAAPPAAAAAGRAAGGGGGGAFAGQRPLPLAATA
jgi:hypothetical protein